ncbi:putative palmitoyltransferase ZDHHC1 isoform X3, partial [Apostichopus japonicus]
IIISHLQCRSFEATQMVFCRTNGWSWPPHPLQFVALGFLLYFSVFYFGVANLVLPSKWQLAGYA